MKPLRRGVVELVRAPVPTAAALLGSIAGALAARAAAVRAGEALLADRPGRAALTWLVGMSVAALVVDTTRAAALTAYAGPPRPLLRTFALGLARTPGMISVRAVELLVYFALGLGAIFVLVRGLPRLGDDPARLALAGAPVLAPLLTLALIVFAASRVAQTVIARGLPPAVALAHGYDVTLRRLPALLRILVVGGLLGTPLLFVALLLPFPLGTALAALVALWLYAALTLVVGADSRLATA